MKTPVKRSMPTKERRHWARLSLAIPVFVRGINGQGREFLEFSTLLNESAGGVLLAMRKPAAVVTGIARNTFFTDSKECEVATSGANAAGARDSHHALFQKAGMDRNGFFSTLPPHCETASFGETLIAATGNGEESYSVTTVTFAMARASAVRLVVAIAIT